MKSVSDRIREAMSARNLKTNELGRLVGQRLGHTSESTGYGSKIANGKVALSEEVAKAVCDVLDVHADWLLFGTGERDRSGPRAPVSEASNFAEAIATARELAGEEIAPETWAQVETVTFAPPLTRVAPRTLYELAKAISKPGV